jgi:hypothetical protein
MVVERHQEHPPARVLQMSARPSWAWGDGSTAAPRPAAASPSEPAPAPAPAPPEPPPAAEVVAGAPERPAWSWGAGAPAAAAPAADPAPTPAEPPPAAAPEPVPAASSERPAWSWGAPPPYLAERAPGRPGPLTRALARARAGVAGVTPVDRTAARVQRVLMMALLAGGWALSLSSPGFEVALPLVAVALLASTAHPALSVPRWISARVLPAARLARPWLTAEDPAPHRVGEAATGLVLVLASLCATVGAPVAAWAIGWAVIAVALVEFTFDVSVVVVVHARLRRARLLRT